MNENELRAALFELATVRSNGEPIASLYLDTRWTDPPQREGSRIFLHQRIEAELDRHADHPAHEAVKRTLERVQQAVQSLRAQPDHAGSHGLAVFACESLGLWRQLALDRPFQDQLSLDDRPHLVQLVRLGEGVQPVIVALVHATGVRIYQVALGGVLQRAVVEGPIPRGHRDDGLRGASGSRYERAQKDQRHIEELVERLHRAGAAELMRLFDAAPASRIVLSGASRQMAALERDLPQRAKDAILARLPPSVSGRANEGRVLSNLAARALEAIAEEDQRAQVRAADEVVGKALGGALAVVGPEDVILAVNERRVHRLVMEEDFAGWGWRCFECDALGMRGADACLYCGGEVTTVEDLREELAGRVLAEDGELEVVRRSSKLHAYQGVGATLRQARGTGARGGMGLPRPSAPGQP